MCQRTVLAEETLYTLGQSADSLLLGLEHGGEIKLNSSLDACTMLMMKKMMITPLYQYTYLGT